MDRAELERWLPHRDPFLLINRAEDFAPMVSLTGVKALEEGDHVFAGHFPGHPVMPGVLLLECMAQTAAAMTAKSLEVGGDEGQLMLASVHSARYRQPVRPGMTVRFPITLEKARGTLYRYRGEALVEDKRVAEAEFTAMMLRADQ